MRPKSNGPGPHNRSMLQAISEGEKNYEATRLPIQILQPLILQPDSSPIRRCHDLVRPIFGCSAASSASYDDHCFRHPRSAKDFECPIGFAGCADRSLFRRTPGADARSIDLSIGDDPASTVAGAKQKFKGQGVGRCGNKTALGSERPGNGSVSGCSSAVGR